MVAFHLCVHLQILPKISAVPDDIDPATIRSVQSGLPKAIQCSTSMFLTLSLPSARDDNPLYPATHLQLTFDYENTGEAFLARSYKSQDLVRTEDVGEGNLWILEVKPEDILRIKVGHGNTTTAIIWIYAWRNEKLLGRYDGGNAPDLGLAGFKSHPVALRRQATWDAAKAANVQRFADSQT